MKSIFNIKGYIAVIPHIQNIYPPEKDNGVWSFGFKYISGVFEYFNFKTLQQARNEYNRLAQAVNDYWRIR